jgi:diaminohydroxyphosphoribosylaminopyrimidine deaminase/5-amino-6-(5-phosphoribosylamino)uracil reductase
VTLSDDIFGPLRTAAGGDRIVVGQIGQSLDGRIATVGGHSHYINGAAGLVHLHHLRALVDAVVVGIGTALADDPQLTVRRVEGRSPARVVIDPKGRLPASARLLNADGMRRIVITTAARNDLPAGVETLVLPCENGRISPSEILAELTRLGLRKILIEGGAETISRFLLAGCLDRLHVVVAPIILGSGRPSFALPEITKVDQALAFPVKIHVLDGEILYDFDLAGHFPVGWAKKST